MRKKSKTSDLTQRYVALDEQLGELLPHVSGVFKNEDDFNRLLMKLRPDGSFLAVMKQDGPDGTPLVCFGSGYGVAGCLLALDSAIQGNSWRADKPWPR